jgi:hypothetical protein
VPNENTIDDMSDEPADDPTGDPEVEQFDDAADGARRRTARHEWLRGRLSPSS